MVTQAMATNSGNPTAPSDQLTKLGMSAAEELRKTVRRALSELFQNFLQQLPRALVVSAQNVSPTERDGFQDLARAVPANERRWLDTFIQQVDGHLIGDVRPVQTAATASPSAEESFVLANLELRAEELHQKLISQLDARLERVRQNVYIPIYTKALAPAGLCRALQDTADALNWPSSQRRILFEKFDDLVVNELQHLYQSLLEALLRINTIVTRSAELPATVDLSAPLPAEPTAEPTAAPPTAYAYTPPPSTAPAKAPAASPAAFRTESPGEAAPAAPRSFLPDAAVGFIPTPESMRPAAARPRAPLPAPTKAAELPPLRIPFNPEKLDTGTLAMLESVASNDAGTVYSDGTLAAELLAISNKIPVPDIAPSQGQIPMQRMNLAGHFLSEAIADPLIPAELKQQHETMRFPLVKSALADETFFTAVTHPLRSLVNEMMLKSATSRVTGSGETRRIADLLQQVLVQFDLAPSFVREAMLTAKPLGEAQMKLFENMQRQQAAQRRESVINEAKRIVAHEIEQSTFSLALPDAVTAFLNRFWGPVLMKRLLQNGSAHASWKEGVLMMQDLVDQLEMRQPDQPPPTPWKALLQKFMDGMTAAGVTAERVHESINSLEAARRTPPFQV